MTAKLSEIWLKYALDDLQSAKVLLKEGIYNMVCFHSQQAVEKLLKSFIATHNSEIPRIHNLIRLNEICEDLHGNKLNLDYEGLIFLNDVYIESRYPADFGIFPSGQPDKEEARKAYIHAKKMGTLIGPLVRRWIKQQSDQDE